jgi:large subunit ribosomal protein L35
VTGEVLPWRQGIGNTPGYGRTALLEPCRPCLLSPLGADIRRASTRYVTMPKLKTKSGAKKRFGRTATGKIKRNWGHKRHRLISKSTQGKRLRRGTTTMEPGDAKLVLTYMPYLRG